MAERLRIEGELKARILSSPEVLLDDRDVMRALVGANDRSMGPNVVDMRGLAMDRLEARLEALESTHRSVIAAAYDNLSGTQAVHRAVLSLLSARTAAEFAGVLEGEAARCLRIDAVRIVIEAEAGEVPVAGAGIAAADAGFVDAYFSLGHATGDRLVALRELGPGEAELYGDGAALRSEAAVRLDLGEGRLPALLALASVDPGHFRPGQGTDLLSFYGGVVERMLRRWLT